MGPMYRICFPGSGILGWTFGLDLDWEKGLDYGLESGVEEGLERGKRGKDVRSGRGARREG